MKKLLLLSLISIFIISCEQEGASDLVTENINYENAAPNIRGDKVAVCHNGNIINVNINALPNHIAHGDAVDLDSDGYFDIDNSCSATDCNDDDPAVFENCINCAEPCGRFCVAVETFLNFEGICYQYIDNTIRIVTPNGDGLTIVGPSTCYNYVESFVLSTGVTECE